MAYVNSVVLAGGKVVKVEDAGLGQRGDKMYHLTYELGNQSYPVVFYDNKGLDFLDSDEGFPAVIYGSLMRFDGEIWIKAHTFIRGSVI